MSWTGCPTTCSRAALLYRASRLHVRRPTLRLAAREVLRGRHREAGAGAEAGPQSRTGEDLGGVAQFLAGVGGHDREAHAGGALGHGGWADGLGEHALLERVVDDPAGHVGLADHERDDVRGGAGDVEALAGERVAQRLGVGAQLGHPAGLLLQQVQRGHRRRGGDRWERGRVQQRARAVDEEAGGHVVAGREAAVGAERLAERAGDDVDLALQAGLGHRAAAVRARARPARAPRRPACATS